MKYLILLSFLFLVGCGNWDSAESLNLKIGDNILVTKGFYKDCAGYITSYSDYSSIDDRVEIRGALCPNVTLSYFFTEAKNIIVVK